MPFFNQQKRKAYDKVVNAGNGGNGEYVSSNAPGGTGKTFLIRSQTQMSLAVASSRIAATLVDWGFSDHFAL